MEDFVVACSQIEDAIVERPDVLDRIGVRRRPLIVVELVLEDFTVEKRTYQNTFLNQNVNILQEQEGADVVILVLDDVLNDIPHCSNLIVLQGTINCRSVEKLTFVVRFLDFVFVKDRKLGLEHLLMLVAQELLHGATVEGEDTYHVGTVKL